jgi:hypothetical protein
MGAVHNEAMPQGLLSKVARGIWLAHNVHDFETSCLRSVDREQDSRFEILLVRDVLIASHHNRELGSFCGFQEFPVFQFSPSHFVGCLHIMMDERAAELMGHVMVEQNLHW